MYKSRDAKVKKQRETHSEIERKRRERMKRETEFLSSQLLDNTVRKDKLSIYKAGAEQLLKYSEKLGKRDFILNDKEYSAVIVNNFFGLCFQILCTDGEIIWCNNTKSILGIDENAIIGNSLYNICEPSLEMLSIIDRHLAVEASEDVENNVGATELLSRNFIVKIKVSEKFPKTHCHRGVDGKWYRFIELCGDIFFNTIEDLDDNGNHIIYKCLGRPLDIATPDNSEIPYFLLKLHAENYRIVSITGKVLDLLGLSNSEIIDKNLSDLIVDDEKQYFKNSFSECISKESINLLLNFKSADQTKRQFSVSLNAVFVNKRLLFVIGKFEKYVQKEEPRDDVSWAKVEFVKEEAGTPIIDNNQEPETQVSFGLEETELSINISPKSTVDESQIELSDGEYLPSNDSFRSLLGDYNDLFYPESIQDLVLEDMNDIKCDDAV